MHDPRCTILTQKRLKEVLMMLPGKGRFIRITKINKTCKHGDIAGYKHSDGHRQMKIDGVIHREHILVWLYIHGEMPELPVFHVDGVLDNNAIENLCYRHELADKRDALLTPDFRLPPPSKKKRQPSGNPVRARFITPPNTPPLPINGETKVQQSKHPGIFYHKRTKRWIPRIELRRVGKDGGYQTEEQAITALDEATMFT